MTQTNKYSVIRRYGTFGAGERSQFYFEIALQPDPDQAGFATPEEQISWGNFQIWVNGVNLCRHSVETETLESVHWYLLPMCEWFAERWDYLFHEQRPPVRYAADSGWASLAETNSPEELELGDTWNFADTAKNAAWAERHSLSTCREGGLFPDLVFRRHQSDVEISWGASLPAGTPLGFRFTSERGCTRLDPLVVAEPLFQVLTLTVDSLVQQMPSSTRIRRLQKMLGELRNSARQEVRVAILAELGDAPDQWLSRWRNLRNRLSSKFRSSPTALDDLFSVNVKATPSLVAAGTCQGALMFGAVAPNLNERDVFQLAELLLEHSLRTTKEDKLAQFAKHNPPKANRAKTWLEGYQLAQDWAEASGLSKDSNDFVDIEAHLAKWGVALQETELSDKLIGGVAVARTNHSPTIVLNKTNPRNLYPTGRRFSIAHELCHLLHDRLAALDLALVSGPWAPPEIERRANAFAAMLLMPDRLVEKAFGSLYALSDPDYEKLLDAAQTLHVSTDALAHHMANRGWIAFEQRDCLLEQVSNRARSARIAKA